MAFKFHRSAGSVHEPAVLNLPGSGVIRANSVVIFDVATVSAGAKAVSVAASTSATSTNIIGVSLDYLDDTSINRASSFVRVIPFVPGQLWEADVLNVITTAQLLTRFRLYDSVTVENTSYDQSLSINGVFMCYAISGASSGSAKVIGEFIVARRAAANNATSFL